MDKPIVHDSKAGFEVIIHICLNNNKPANLAGDKGYILDKETRDQLLKLKGIRLICPKKKYTKKKKYIRQKIINIKKKELVISSNRSSALDLKMR